MIYKRLFYWQFVFTLIVAAFCTGCSDQEKKDTVASTQPVEEKDYLEVQLKPSFHEITLAWDQVEQASRYVITRKEHKSKGIDHTEMGKLLNEGVIAEVSPEVTSFRDTDVKAGNYYIYDIYAYRNNASERHVQETIQLTLGDVNWDSTSLKLSDFSKVVSPSEIVLNAVFTSSDYGIEPMGMEIYRGTSPLKMKKYADIPFAEDEFLEKGGEFRYTDESVETGKTYYYQVKGYIDYEGTREYGGSSDYLKRTAVLSVGEYSMDYIQKNNGFELSLQSNSKDNATLELVANQLNGLVDYIYQKNDYSYSSASLCLDSYSQGTREWKSYQGQDLCLKGGEKIVLRFVPMEGEKKLVAPETCPDYAKILLMTKYNGEYINMHFDLREKQVSLTDLDSETSMFRAYWRAAEITMRERAILKKADQQNAVVPDLYGNIYSNVYGESFSFWLSYEKNSVLNYPDGVEIYRSTDNHNFSKVADIAYPSQGNMGYEEHVEYQDPNILPGNIYYYKARNYIDTDDGRIYGKMLEDGVPYFANYRSGRYKMWQEGEKKVTGRQPIVIGIYSCSLGNPPLEITSSYGTIQKSDEQATYGLSMTEYSTDGIHWEKITKKTKQLNLLPKKTLYLKIEPDDIDWEDAETLTLELSKAKNTYIGWEDESESVDLSYNVNAVRISNKH